MIEVLLEAERALSFGLLDQAERMYRQASDADPRNSIAVVGLARVALERGNEAGALAEAERALSIDNENEAARRMAERLREVLSHRAATASAAQATAAAEPVVAREPTPEPQPQVDAEPDVRSETEPEPAPAGVSEPEPPPTPELEPERVPASAYEPERQATPTPEPGPPAAPDRPVLTPTTIQRAPAPVVAEPASMETLAPAETAPPPDVAESETTPPPDAQTPTEPAPEPRRRGGIIGWLLRLFGRG